jgi:hypothetical protein
MVKLIDKAEAADGVTRNKVWYSAEITTNQKFISNYSSKYIFC